jgi:ribosomal protein L20
MTDNAQSIEVEELVITVHALVEQQQELLADSQAQGENNNEHVQQISAMIKQLTELLKTYQDKEQLIIDNTSQVLKNNINAAFQQNQERYHALIDQGFTIHIDTATKKLSTVATKIEKQFEDLEIAAHNSKTEFEGRQSVFKMYEDTYETQSRKMKESVDSTTTAVINSTKDRLDDVANDFSYNLVKHLSWKVTAMLGGVCLSIMLLTFGSAWLFVPSKAEISQRESQYNALEKAQLFNKVIQADDGYYAEIDTTKCRKDFKSKFWSNPTWCKFK